jgi:hypothetical protein
MAEDDKITTIGLSRNAVGRGWTDLLDNQIAIMLGLLCMVPPNDKTADIRMGLQYRINQTANFLAQQPASSDPIA